MAKLKFNQATPLYRRDASACAIDQMATLLDAVYALGKPVVLFVHGRGKEPQKSLRGSTLGKGHAVPKVEDAYDSTVVMFNWNSAFPGVSVFDRSDALAATKPAADALFLVLQQLSTYLAATGAKRPSLLVHSMGSIVLQHLVNHHGWPAGPLFSHVLLTQPDADDAGHAAWLEPIASVEDVYVTSNADDWVLQQSNDQRPAGCKPLGLGTGEPHAPSARYIDLSDMGPFGKHDNDHEVFAEAAMDGQRHVWKFFSQAIRGETVVLDLAANVAKIDGNTYRLRVD